MTTWPAGGLRRVVDDGPRPEPMVHPDTAPFWEGLERGELLIQVCGSCATWRFPFAPVCHHCRSFEVTWQPISPIGRVAAAARVERATGDQVWSSRVPFVSGNVDLEHDIRLPGRILCDCGAALTRGTRVEAVVLTAPGRTPVHAFAHDCVTLGD